MSTRFGGAIGLCTIVALAHLACSSDDDPRTPPDIAKYCSDLVASPSIGCCSAADRADRNFAARYGFTSANECGEQLRAATASGRRAFDGEAASSCLAHLASRGCGVATTAAVRAAEIAAGCSRVLAGRQGEGQACGTHEDCKPGLVCPPVKETGGSFCSRPAASNQACLGGVASVDHPACEPGLDCELIGENPAGCPSPPCLQYRCVPLAEEGESCTSVSGCRESLACRDGTCRGGPASGEGGPCRATEHCADGLYCDPSSSTCAPRKAAGTACGTAPFECKGVCTTGTCAAFCGSD